MLDKLNHKPSILKDCPLPTRPTGCHLFPTPRQNALRMSTNLSFRSITHFRLRIQIQCKQAKIPYREVWIQKVRVRKRRWGKGLSRWKVYSSFKFQALAPKGLVFAPTTKNEKISGAFALDKSNFILRRFGCAVPTQQNVAKLTIVAVNVLAKNIFSLKI